MAGYEGHVSKRQRVDDNDHYNREDRHNPQPSPVIHVRGLSEFVSEADLMQAVQHFGNVNYIMMMAKRHQALIEFEEIGGAKNCVNYSLNNPIYVGQQAAFFNYSTSQRIQRPAPGMDDPSRPPNHILLFTILNPQYPITVDVMQTICSAYGQVLRIVIFKKNGVQAMIEFENVECATRAKQSLNGADIYSGCCTLKIEFANQTRLNVIRNDSESWDYTNPNLGKTELVIVESGVKVVPYTSGNEPQTGNRPLLPDPRSQGGSYGSAPPPSQGGYNQGQGYSQQPQGYGPPAPQSGYGQNQGYSQSSGYGQTPQGGYGGPPAGGSSYGPPPPQNSYGGSGYNEPEYGGGYNQGPPRGQYDDRYPPSSRDRYSGDRYGGPPGDRYSKGDRGYRSSYNDGPPSASGLSQGAVIMVYGLDNEMNCDRLFNLFCLYGNVVRIKYLKTKDNAAMVQMGDALAVDRCMNMLNNIYFFGNKLQLGHSKQAFLKDVASPHDLPDGTTSFKDFMGSRNNRFSNPEAASKNRIVGASKILHFFNTPPSITEEEITERIVAPSEILYMYNIPPTSNEDEILELFGSTGAKKPAKVKIFPSKSERSCTGLCEFESKAWAIEALILTNHISIDNPTGKAPFIFKLCFSPNTISEVGERRERMERIDRDRGDRGDRGGDRGSDRGDRE